MKFSTLLAFIASGIALPTEDATSYNDPIKSMESLANKHYDENIAAFDKSLTYEEIVEVTKKLLQSRKDEFTGSDKLYAGNENRKYLVYLNNYYARSQGKYIRSNAKKALQNANVTGYSSDAVKIGKKEAINSLNEGIREYMKLIEDFCIKESSEENCLDTVWEGHDEDIPLDDDSIVKSDPEATTRDDLPEINNGIKNLNTEYIARKDFPGNGGTNRSPPADTVENGAETKEETDSGVQGDA
ncbi:hypothetical protein DSO57_1024008 [Entomophthora muscae]|uniref:Uncharacterized protein n=1 Tax=Entomophthora muscae TaxID=34485 RepID=A0ACC2U249_9FUNG|nr:hypothetical protein DSO57_1024008 [Entomophthora muscae]